MPTTAGRVGIVLQGCADRFLPQTGHIEDYYLAGLRKLCDQHGAFLIFDNLWGEEALRRDEAGQCARRVCPATEPDDHDVVELRAGTGTGVGDQFGDQGSELVADEDLERENAEKTSSVHFLRFELSDAMVVALRGGARLAVGIDHPAYLHSIDGVGEGVRASLLGDLA